MNTYFTPLICLATSPHMHAFPHPHRSFLSLSFRAVYRLFLCVLWHLCWLRGGVQYAGRVDEQGVNLNSTTRVHCFLPQRKTVHRYGCGCFKLRDLRLCNNAYRTSPNTRVCQYVLVIVNHPDHFLLSFLVWTLLPAHCNCRSDYTL